MAIILYASNLANRYAYLPRELRLRAACVVRCMSLCVRVIGSVCLRAYFVLHCKVSAFLRIILAKIGKKALMYEVKHRTRPQRVGNAYLRVMRKPM